MRDRRLPDGAGGTALALACVLAVAVLSVPSVRSADDRATASARRAALTAAALPVPAAAPVREAAVPVLPVPGPVEPALPEPEPVAPAADAPVVAPSAPPAAPRPGPPPPPHAEARARAALDALDYPWQELGYRIRFEAHPGGSTAGLTDPSTRTITVYVRASQSDLSLRATLAHEIAHALDLVAGSDAQRAEYLQRRGLPSSTPWFPCDRCDDLSSGAGDWAEVFAYWLVGPGDFRSRLGGPPTDEQLRRIVPLFAPPSARVPPPTAAPPASPSPSPSPSRRPGLLSDSRP